MTKVFFFGIDGAAPEIIFGRWKDDLPTINGLMKRGCYAKMNSTIPPSTIVAWNSMISGKDTSEIGVFSYTYRDKNGDAKLVNSSHIKCRLMWDILGEQKKSIALYVPLSYPVKPINGCIVSDFLTPGVESKCAYPEWLHENVKAVKNPEIFFDVVAGLAGHKSLDVDALVKRTYEMTDMQLDIARDLIVNEPWEFFMMVTIGTDRLQHMTWRHFDETHRKFIPNSPHKNALHDFYVYLDKKLGELLKLVGKDTVVIVASDHGMVKQEGKININNWLISEGYLVLKEGVNAAQKQKFDISLVDMERSIACGGGAYNGRIYINRKKAGKDYAKILEDIEKKLIAITDDKGNKIDTKVYRKEDIYKDTSSIECPDLTVYFDDLRWASNPDFGNDGLYSWESALGADSAGHSRQGIFIISGNGIAPKGQLVEVNIAQVAPTILDIMKVATPKDITVKRIEVKR